MMDTSRLWKVSLRSTSKVRRIHYTSDTSIWPTESLQCRNWKRVLPGEEDAMQGLDEEEDGQIAKKAEIGVEEEAKILRVAGTTLTKIVNPKLANDRDMHISLH